MNILNTLSLESSESFFGFIVRIALYSAIFAALIYGIASLCPQNDANHSQIIHLIQK
jgi:hypothetical protein